MSMPGSPLCRGLGFLESQMCTRNGGVGCPHFVEKKIGYIFGWFPILQRSGALKPILCLQNGGAQPPLVIFWGYGFSKVAQLRFAWQAWHPSAVQHIFDNASKAVLCGRRNTFASPFEFPLKNAASRVVAKNVAVCKSTLFFSMANPDSSFFCTGILGHDFVEGIFEGP